MLARGYCSNHYQKFRKFGDPLADGNQLRRVDIYVRAMAMLDVRGPDDCWPALTNVNGYGYAVINNPGRNSGTSMIHRVVYERMVGPIPEGLTLDHECHNRDLSCAGGVACLHRRCANPVHMTPKTTGDNTRAGQGPAKSGARMAAKTHCPHGHPYDEENTIYRPNGGGRVCRACRHRIDADRGYGKNRRRTKR